VEKLRVIRNNKRYLRKLAVRRFMTMTLMVLVFLCASYVLYANRIERLNDVRTQLEAYEEELADIMLRQGFYENEIIRLEDDDFVAMLARQQYFRSLPHEIVFRIAEEEIDSSEEDTDGN